ncbi:MAG: hypothetical protein CL402_10265 [Acidiferrobacteraceae bacterium]|jgi:sugar phosphate isomerase/epimerase|nr:hypothetical protein [Acidiferrobacteraceae bacterium]|tara:strand:+ start:1699 stop:2508 length:810 start_codon:yes stop_codon:yes gene_type:complete
MEHAISNIALPAYNHIQELHALSSMGLTGLEVAPSRIWKDTYGGLTNRQVNDYRLQAEKAQLRIVGLHSLFFDQPDLGLFKDPDQRDRSINFLVHLSGVCRDLGGKTLIYGAGRRRNELPANHARSEALRFMDKLIPRIENHGTILCFEPLGPEDTDFLNSVEETLGLVKEIGHPALRIQVDAKALVQNDELKEDVFEKARSYLVHVHANEPDLGILGTSNTINHARIGELLSNIGYDAYVSAEQRMIDRDHALEAVAQSAKVLIENYR